MAWWLWAIGLATAASRTTNPALLVLILAVLGLVVAARRSDAPWSRSFKYYLIMAAVVIAIRVVFRAVFGGGVDDRMHVLFSLPRVPLPSWAAGVQLGGPVTLEGTVAALLSGLQLGTLLCCLGAANTLANPKRALRVLPGALYELGVAVVVTFTVAPQLVESAQRVRRARRLRAGAGGGHHALRAVAIPVLEDAFERSLLLASAMDSRGYGRTAGASRAERRATGALLLAGLLGLCVGAYGLLDGAGGGGFGLPGLAVGALLCGLGLVVGGRRVGRTQYRPDPWQAPEWGVVACGLVPAVVFVGSFATPLAGLHPSTDPLAWPSLPLLPAAAVGLAGLAAVIAPPPLRSVRTALGPTPARRSPEPRPSSVPS